MIEFCQECGEIIDELRAMKGKKTCKKCLKKAQNKAYYDNNKESINASSIARHKEKKAEEKKLQEKRDKKAEAMRKYRKRVKDGTVSSGNSLISEELAAQILKDLYGIE